MYLLSEILSAENGCKSPDLRIEKDLAAILYTSGSTGKPKGVMLSHEQVMAGSSIVSDYLEITSSDRIIGVLPLSFDAGSQSAHDRYPTRRDLRSDDVYIRS